MNLLLLLVACTVGFSAPVFIQVTVTDGTTYFQHNGSVYIPSAPTAEDNARTVESLSDPFMDYHLDYVRKPHSAVFQNVWHLPLHSNRFSYVFEEQLPSRAVVRTLCTPHYHLSTSPFTCGNFTFSPIIAGDDGASAQLTVTSNDGSSCEKGSSCAAVAAHALGAHLEYKQRVGSLKDRNDDRSGDARAVVMTLFLLWGLAALLAPVLVGTVCAHVCSCCGCFTSLSYKRAQQRALHPAPAGGGDKTLSSSAPHTVRVASSSGSPMKPSGDDDLPMPLTAGGGLLVGVDAPTDSVPAFFAGRSDAAQKGPPPPSAALGILSDDASVDAVDAGEEPIAMIALSCCHDGVGGAGRPEGVVTESTVWCVCTMMVVFVVISIVGGIVPFLALCFGLLCLLCCGTCVALVVRVFTSGHLYRMMPAFKGQPKGVVARSKCSALPMPLGSVQCAMVWVLALLIVALLAASVVVYAIWTPATYELVHRHDSRVDTEHIPPNTHKTLHIMYAYQDFAGAAGFGPIVELLTDVCGPQYRVFLKRGDREKVLKESWVDLYKVDMSIYNEQNLERYDSVNAWFVRAINTSYRPVAPLPALVQPASSWAFSDGGVNPFISPADCRVVTFSNTDALKVWVKGTYFSAAGLLDVPAAFAELPARLDGGAVGIFRLAPQDYHRFNAPVTGHIVAAYDVPGSMWSVGVDAARSEQAFYNYRRVVIFRLPLCDASRHVEAALGSPLDPYKYVAYVAIGATCVGSVQWTLGGDHDLSPDDLLGKYVTAGQEMGYMQFGGSTVAVLAEPGVWTVDDDLLHASTETVEHYVKVGEQVGTYPTCVR